MTRNKQVRVIFAMIMIVIMMLPAVAQAADSGPSQPGYGQPGPRPEGWKPDGPSHPGPGGPMKPGEGPKPPWTGPSVPPPIAITGPRVNPRVIPHSDVVNPAVAYNYVVTGNVPQALEANAADGGKTQSDVGRGIKQTTTGVGAGLTLYATPNVCNNFNAFNSYAVPNGKSDIWSDWFAGWGPFAIDNGYYKAKNVAFTMERVVGPGNNYNDNLSSGNGEQASVKIASHEPYAGGFGSPIIPVPEEYRGGSVMVSVKYLIWDHDQGGKQGGPDGNDWDWASMGVKPGAAGDQAYYVNGYVRGEWAELTQTVELGWASDIMVLIQGQSPAVLNSNIYFDDVKIAFSNKDGSKSVYLSDCTLAGTIK
jgi:hypothetical protein